MLDTMKARGCIGDARALEDVHAAGLNSSVIATTTGFSQPITGYVIGKDLLVLAVLRRENRRG